MNRRQSTSISGKHQPENARGEGTITGTASLDSRRASHPVADHVMMIDIFNHFMAKGYLERLGKLMAGHVALPAFPRLKTLWDVDARLALLDEFDGLQQVLSLANPPLELIAAPDRTPELARIANDSLAELCGRHPDRFPAFVASLPMNNIDASLA